MTAISWRLTRAAAGERAVLHQDSEGGAEVEEPAGGDLEGRAEVLEELAAPCPQLDIVNNAISLALLEENATISWWLTEGDVGLVEVVQVGLDVYAGLRIGADGA